MELPRAGRTMGTWKKATFETSVRDLAKNRRVSSKLDGALYKKFGGIVSITKFGQVPVVARAALLREYRKDGNPDVLDKNLELRFWTSLDEPPASAPLLKRSIQLHSGNCRLKRSGKNSFP